MAVELLTESLQEVKLNVEIPHLPLVSPPQYESSSSLTSSVSSSPTDTTLESANSSTSLDTSVTSDSNTTIASPIPGPVPRRSKSSGILKLGSRARAASLPGDAQPQGSSSTLSVRFAPLPELAPRRRKSTVPLGVAARTQMMQRRKRIVYAPPDADEYDSAPMWTEEESEEHMRRQLKAKEREKERAARKKGNESVGEEDDPFITLGRIFKDAWKRMADKGKEKEKEKEKQDSEKGGNEKERGTGRMSSEGEKASSKHPSPNLGDVDITLSSSPRLLDAESEGKVKTSPKDIGQSDMTRPASSKSPEDIANTLPKPGKEGR